MPLRQSELAEFEALAGVPVVAERSDAFYLQHTYGGKQMTGPAGTCTSGFTVKDAVSGITGVLTAGHCYNTDATYWETATVSYLADLAGRRWDKNQDFAWFQTSHIEYPEFFSGSGLRTQTSTKPRLEMEGNPVCHYGVSTGASCGIAEDVHFRPPSEICNGQVCDLSGS